MKRRVNLACRLLNTIVSFDDNTHAHYTSVGRQPRLVVFILILAALVIFGILWSRKSPSAPGVLFLDFVALSAGAHLFLEAFRGDGTFVFGDFRLAQVLAWAVLAIVVFAKDGTIHKTDFG